MPWPPTGMYDPVIDLDTQLSAPVTPGLSSSSPTGSEQEMPSGNIFDPQTGMITLGALAPTVPGFDLLPGDDEPRLKDVSTDKKRQGVIDFALSKVAKGIWYHWGGTTDAGYDCSGLVMKAFASVGIQMPRISWSQAGQGKRVKISDLQPGDLVAWDHQAGDGGADHIAIYMGNGKIIEAAHTGTQLRVRKLGKNEGAWGVKLDY